jgi:cation transport ATPase
MAIAERPERVQLELKEMTCASCAARIERKLTGSRAWRPR